jgi:hypothetical protein
MSEAQKRGQFEEFDKLGVDQVRRRLPNWTGIMRQWAIEWLAPHDQAERTSQNEMASAAARAAAAERAASAAESQATTAREQKMRHGRQQ